MLQCPSCTMGLAYSPGSTRVQVCNLCAKLYRMCGRHTCKDDVGMCIQCVPMRNHICLSKCLSECILIQKARERLERKKIKFNKKKPFN